MLRALSLLLALVSLLGCPPAEKKDAAPKPTAACTRVGATCEVSAGKLGTCVAKDECPTGECFICQSQH